MKERKVEVVEEAKPSHHSSAQVSSLTSFVYMCVCVCFMPRIV